MLPSVDSEAEKATSFKAEFADERNCSGMGNSRQFDVGWDSKVAD